MFGDISDDVTQSIKLGLFVKELAPSFLRQAEVVVERYIDPCSLIMALDCSPFIWHPFIRSLLEWPAAIVFLTIGVFFWFLSHLFQGFQSKRQRSFHRDGR
jgi:hypothetical protein